MTTPILAQLRDAAEQRGWVRGLTFNDIVSKSGRTPEQAASALRAWRLAGTVKFTEQHTGDPETITALRITKETRALTTAEAAKIEANMLGSAPEDQAVLLQAMDLLTGVPPTGPLAKHALDKARERKPRTPNFDAVTLVVQMNPESAPLSPITALEGDVDELQRRLREGDTFPAIRELIARENEMLEAAATFERHGMGDLAEAAMERLKTQTPLERDVIRLYKVLMDLPFDASEGSPQ